MIRDGFGDDLSVDEQIANYEAWLHHRAHRLLPSLSPDHDDLVQEGRIGMWHALEKADETIGSLPGWLTTHANWAMKDAVTKKRWTGQPSRAGKKPFRGSLVSLDILLENDEAVADMLQAADVLEAVLLAYHAGEIAAALESLSPRQREYVVLRFWYGYQTAALKQHFGYEPHALWHSEKNGARKKLRSQLAHLAY